MHPTHAELEEPVKLHRMVSAAFVLKVVVLVTLCVIPPSYALLHVSMVCAAKSMSCMHVTVIKAGLAGHVTGEAVMFVLPTPVRMEELALNILDDQSVAAERVSEETFVRLILMSVPQLLA